MLANDTQILECFTAGVHYPGRLFVSDAPYRSVLRSYRGMGVPARHLFKLASYIDSLES